MKEVIGSKDNKIEITKTGPVHGGVTIEAYDGYDDVTVNFGPHEAAELVRAIIEMLDLSVTTSQTKKTVATVTKN